ncbi:MAG: AI-2E family transporter [Patescibacteria group bacterium]
MAQWQKIDVSSSTIFRIILILVGVWFIYIIRDILLVLFAAIVLAWAIEPLARYLSRFRIPRAVTVIAVYVAAIAIVALVVTILIPPVTEQVRSLAQVLPQLVGQVEGWLQLPGVTEGEVVGQAQQFLTRVGESLGNVGAGLLQQTRNVLSNVVLVIFVFVITFYLVIEKDPLKKLFRLLLPREHTAYVDRIIDKVQQQIARWIRAQLLLGVVVGVVVGLGLWLLGVPYALVLALIAGVLEIVPAIGPVLAAIPGVAIGATQGWVLGLATLGFYWAVQQLENHVLVPNIMRKAVGLNPIVTLIAVLLGARLIGIAGVVLAVPAAMIISVFLADFFSAEEELSD